MISLNVYQRLARGSAHYANITPYAPDWRRTTRAIGGYMAGSFTATGLSRADMLQWYDRFLGCRIVETMAGMVSWEGMIYEMRLVLDGVEYCRTLDSEWFHNRVKAVYSAGTGRATIDWSENTDSSDEYGEMNYLATLGGTSSAAATAYRDRHLMEHAWPRSRMVGGIALGRNERGADSLVVYCVGYWATLGWRYQESTLAAANASAHVSTLVAASEFVTDGRVETNTLSVSLTVNTAARLGDLIGDVIRQGDVEGNVWQGGVYAGRKFVYEQAPVAVSHYLRNGVLVDKASRPVVPSLLLPGFLLQNSAAPVAGQPPGTSEAWDDPRVAYVEEVEFERPDVLRLKVQEIEETVSIIASQLARGTNLFLGGVPEIRSPWNVDPPKDYLGRGG